MCGIFGAFSADSSRSVHQNILRGMGETLVHRGPDGRGLYVAGPFGMGMRRLSIIDLKTGDQPMANEDRSIWVVFNGEIYNYRELTTELLAKGHRFATASDTEVLVHLYEEHGEACVERLRGMFAFAVWDEPRRTLLLARDRLGIKPLYYTQTPHGVVFGSELKAVARNAWVSRGVSRRALSAYLQCGYVPDPLSIFEHVVKLPPGHTLTVRDGQAGVPRRYWDSAVFFRRPSTPSADHEAVEALWERLQNAVRSHLVSDVPVGAFLSGGVDSSAVLAVMAQQAGVPIKTFSVGFSENGYNELPYARQVADWFGTEHYELLVEPDDLGLLQGILRTFDEPFADASAIPTYLVSRLARQHVKVVLSGDGGDELFAGYDRYVVDHRRRYLGILGDIGLGTRLRCLCDVLPEGTPGRNYLANILLPRTERYLDSVSLFRPSALQDLLEPAVASDVVDPFHPHVVAGEGLDALSRLQHIDLNTYLPGHVLTKLDRMSMAHSLEARVPLLDHPLVEFACGLPPRLRLRAGKTKYLLKLALKRRVPEEVVTRPKQGFAMPLHGWLRRLGRTFFRERLENALAVRDGYVRRSALNRLLDLYERTGRHEFRGRLWALFVFEVWYEGRE